MPINMVFHILYLNYQKCIDNNIKLKFLKEKYPNNKKLQLKDYEDCLKYDPHPLYG